MIESKVLGVDHCSNEIIEYTLTNSSGSYVKLINLGATVTAIVVQNNRGEFDDVTLGYNDWRSYQGDGAAMGKSVGRYANRVAKGRFAIDGKEYTLAINNGENALHGGPTGFQNRVWGSMIEGENVIFKYISQDGEEGYPAELTVSATYSWGEDNSLNILYEAVSNGTTIVNLTNHLYLNLKGDGVGTIESHNLKLNALQWLPTDNSQIPTGEMADVRSTPMDFIEPTMIGSRIDNDFEALVIGRGYDHCWVVDGADGVNLKYVGTLSENSTGREVEIYSTQMGVQIYTGNWLEGSPEGKRATYVNRSGIAIECQNFPDAPNREHFPSSLLHKGEKYKHQIIYKFKTV